TPVGPARPTSPVAGTRHRRDATHATRPPGAGRAPWEGDTPEPPNPSPTNVAGVTRLPVTPDTAGRRADGGSSTGPGPPATPARAAGPMRRRTPRARRASRP